MLILCNYVSVLTQPEMLILFDYVTILTQNLWIDPGGCPDNSHQGLGIGT